ncbi:MAG: doxx family protein [Flavobacteriaceae bacterium]|nr:doxx family protein [Flavobacteriaceae bacterium]
MFESIKLSIKNINWLQTSIGFVYLLFGVLKFFPHLSPAEDLAELTIRKMTFGLIEGRLSLILLALLESWIGIFLMLNIQSKLMIKVAIGHMICTFFPFFLDPELTFNLSSKSLSIVGQYILKNLIIISTLFNLYRSLSVQKTKQIRF